MFGKKEKVPVPTYDVTQKIKKTWWGGTKLIPTTKSEQRKLKAEILKRNPNAIVLDRTVRQKRKKNWNGSTALRILMLLCEKANPCL